MTRRPRIVPGITLLVAFCLAAYLPNVSPAGTTLEQRTGAGSLLKEAQQHFAAGRYDSALVRLGDVENIDPGNQDAIYYTALSYLALSDTSRAETVLKEGVGKSPLSSRIKLLLVRIYLMTGKYGEAEKALETILRFKPRDPEVLYLRGLAGLALGDSVRALDDWHKALEHVDAKGKWR